MKGGGRVGVVGFGWETKGDFPQFLGQNNFLSQRAIHVTLITGINRGGSPPRIIFIGFEKQYGLKEDQKKEEMRSAPRTGKGAGVTESGMGQIISARNINSGHPGKVRIGDQT